LNGAIRRSKDVEQMGGDSGVLRNSLITVLKGLTEQGAIDELIEVSRMV
jgi:hypothetical protein